MVRGYRLRACGVGPLRYRGCHGGSALAEQVGLQRQGALEQRDARWPRLAAVWPRFWPNWHSVSSFGSLKREVNAQEIRSDLVCSAQEGHDHGVFGPRRGLGLSR